MFKFTAALLKEASMRDTVLKGNPAHWRRVKSGRLVHIAAGPGTPPGIIKVKLENLDRQGMARETMDAYLSTKQNVIAGTYVPMLEDWIDFLAGHGVVSTWGWVVR